MTFFDNALDNLLENELARELIKPLGVNDSEAPDIAPQFECILTKAFEGETLERSDAIRLADLPKSQLIYLVLAAMHVRERAKGNIVTYSKNVFVPLTRLCRDNCGYCTFKIEPGEGELFIPPDEVVDMARTGRKLGCTELLFVTGDKPEKKYKVYRDALGAMGFDTTAQYLMNMCEVGLAEDIFPHSNLGISTPEELERLRETNPSMGLMLENISPRLLEKGEAHWGSPDKVPHLRMQTMKDAGELRIPWTSGILVGIGENWHERIDSLIALRELDEEYGHIQEIIVQNFTPKQGIRMENHYAPSFLDMLKTVAIARLIFPDKMNIQVPPNLNHKEFPLYVLAGVNDLGGVSPVTIDYVNPEAPWPQVEVMEEAVTGLGLKLKERLPVYPEYINEEFISENVLNRARNFIDRDGYIKGYIPEEAHHG